MIALSISVAVGVAWLCYVAYSLHQVVQMDGTWYNELRREDRYTYRNRLRVTLRERLRLGASIALSIGLGALLMGVSYVFVLGLLAL